MSTALALTNRYQELLAENNLTQNVKKFEGLYSEIAVSEDGYIAIYHPYTPEEKGMCEVTRKKITIPEQHEWLQILHISQINDVDIDIDGIEQTKVSGGAGGAVAGALIGGLFGFSGAGAVIGSSASSGKVKSNTIYNDIKLILNTKDFNNPRIEVKLHDNPIVNGKKFVTSKTIGLLSNFPCGLRPYLNDKKSFLSSSITYQLNKEGQRLFEEVYNGGEPNFTVIEELHSTLSQLLAAQKQSETAAAAAPQLSAADEIAKFKGLLDNGVITQEEFDAKKRQLLGL